MKRTSYDTSRTMAIVVLGLVLSTACVSSSAPSSVTLSILQVGGNETYWTDLTTRFEQANPSITVKVERVPGPNFQTKWNAYIAAKAGPDLISIQGGQIWLPYKETLQPLNELRPQVTQYVNPENFCDKYDCINGDVYAIPYNLQGYVLYYNKLILQQAGLPQTAPTTWTEMVNACAKVRALGKTCWELGMKDLGEGQILVGALPNELMTLAQEKGFASNQTKWTDPEVVNIWKVWQDAIKRGWFNTDAPALTDTPDAEGAFTSGKAAFMVGYIADIKDYATLGKGIGDVNLGAALLPTIEDNFPLPGVSPSPAAKIAGFAAATAFGLSVWSKRKAEALKYINFEQSKANQQKYLNEVGVAARNDLDSTTAAAGKPALAQIEVMIAHGGHALVFDTGFKEIGEMGTQAQKLFLGQTTPEAACAAIQKAREAP